MYTDRLESAHSTDLLKPLGLQCMAGVCNASRGRVRVYVTHALEMKLAGEVIKFSQQIG